MKKELINKKQMAAIMMALGFLGFVFLKDSLLIGISAVAFVVGGIILIWREV